MSETIPWSQADKTIQETADFANAARANLGVAPTFEGPPAMSYVAEQAAMVADGLRAAGLNTSGIVPFDHRCLVLHDPVETKIGSIIIPDNEADKRKFAQTKATVIACGHMAFAEARHDARQFGVEATFPEPGDRVLVGRYTGDTHKGADGREYVVLNDSDIIAFIGKSED